jgi:ribose transport system substrate-binding protein
MGIILGRMGNTTAETRVNGMLSGMIFQRSAMMGNEITRAQAAYEATLLFQDLRKNGTFSSDTWKMACLGSGEGNWTFEGGIDIGETIVAANQDKLNLIIGENDFQGMGASQAVNNYGLQDQIKIASPGNGMKTELEKVKDGTLICDGPHNGQAFAMETMNLIKALNENSLDVDTNNLPMMETFKAFNLNPDTMDTYWDDDPENLYHKTAPLEILDVPGLKAKIEDGSYFEEWVPEE